MNVAHKNRIRSTWCQLRHPMKDTTIHKHVAILGGGANCLQVSFKYIANITFAKLIYNICDLADVFIQNHYVIHKHRAL